MRMKTVYQIIWYTVKKKKGLKEKFTEIPHASENKQKKFK